MLNFFNHYINFFLFQHFGNRLQTQNIFLDFLNEPLDSLRRRREGMYVSYTFGRDERAIKVENTLIKSRSRNIVLIGCQHNGTVSIQKEKLSMHAMVDSIY